ncbi:DUF1566 domain-containing protein [Desulfonatronum sp. SC1]|uniref:Lcl C-terminal domain-containing protein n=1 Tax=Desulfonatronum sp. SC1 TaxID=2109626 RepID=UPI000D31D3ED|nr:DUF1566 domain-containing protein [Desulfonatronum sp. SC1]PTN33014.1 hypothetical protein C6366_15340 [Desulfonatronum sp. SC1]
MKKLLAVATMAVMLCLTGLLISDEAHAQRFVDNGDGTVTDTQTNLMWTKDANLFGKLFWDDAMSRCGSFNISGKSGWRLPSRDELKTQYNAIQGSQPFTGIQQADTGPSSSYFWSGTATGADYAWGVSMSDGGVNDAKKEHPLSVWCASPAH